MAILPVYKRIFTA